MRPDKRGYHDAPDTAALAQAEEKALHRALREARFVMLKTEPPAGETPRAVFCHHGSDTVQNSPISSGLNMRKIPVQPNVRCPLKYDLRASTFPSCPAFPAEEGAARNAAMRKVMTLALVGRQMNSFDALMGLLLSVLALFFICYRTVFHLLSDCFASVISERISCAHG